MGVGCAISDLNDRSCSATRLSLARVFNGLRWIVRSGSSWRLMPHDPPPWYVVSQQTQRWIKAKVFEELVSDLRAMLRIAEGRQEMPTAAIFDSRTLQSSVESGGRAGYDGAKRRKGNKVHLAVDTLGHLLALCVTAANEQDRAQVAELAERVQSETGETVEIACVDQGCTGENAADAANMESGSKSSNSRRRNEALCFCRVTGWWSGVSAGCRVSVGWRATMSACLKPWLGCIT